MQTRIDCSDVSWGVEPCSNIRHTPVAYSSVVWTQLTFTLAVVCDHGMHLHDPAAAAAAWINSCSWRGMADDLVVLHNAAPQAYYSYFADSSTVRRVDTRRRSCVHHRSDLTYYADVADSLAFHNS